MIELHWLWFIGCDRSKFNYVSKSSSRYSVWTEDFLILMRNKASVFTTNFVWCSFILIVLYLQLYSRLHKYMTIDWRIGFPFFANYSQSNLISQLVMLMLACNICKAGKGYFVYSFFVVRNLLFQRLPSKGWSILLTKSNPIILFPACFESWQSPNPRIAILHVLKKL